MAQDKESSHDDKLGMRPSEDGEIPLLAILYRHTRQIEKVKEGDLWRNKLRRRVERRS